METVQSCTLHRNKIHQSCTVMDTLDIKSVKTFNPQQLEQEIVTCVSVSHIDNEHRAVKAAIMLALLKKRTQTH